MIILILHTYFGGIHAWTMIQRLAAKQTINVIHTLHQEDTIHVPGLQAEGDAFVVEGTFDMQGSCDLGGAIDLGGGC